MKPLRIAGFLIVTCAVSVIFLVSSGPADERDKPATNPTPSTGSRQASSTPATQAAKVYAGWPFNAQEATKRQDETAKALGIEKTIAIDLGNKVTMKLVLIPAGKFMMGSPADEKDHQEDEGPQCEMTIASAYYVGVYEVTKGQFAQFISDSRYKTDGETAGTAYAWDGKRWGDVKGSSWKEPGFPQTAEHPVVCVSRNDAVEFCKWLSKKVGKSVLLPSEAQWEYACRAGTNTAYPWGDKPDDGKGWANCQDQTAAKQFFIMTTAFSWEDGFAFTSPVGQFKPNNFGLYDMIGNVLEWGNEWYDERYFAHVGKIVPLDPVVRGALRGGSWHDDPFGSRTANRRGVQPDGGSEVGFRVVVEVK